MTQTLIPAEPELKRFTVTEYHRMLECGILKEGDPYELIEGRIVKKMTKGRPHSIATKKTRLILDSLPLSGWHVEDEPAIIASDLSEPEPDAVIIRGSLEDYPTSHPEAKDVGLVIEIADSSLHHDRTDKKEMYAAAGIPVYWIVNVVHRQIEVTTAPTGPALKPTYQVEAVYRPGDTAPLILDGQTIAEIPVASLLP